MVAVVGFIFGMAMVRASRGHHVTTGLFVIGGLVGAVVSVILGLSILISYAWVTERFDKWSQQRRER